MTDTETIRAAAVGVAAGLCGMAGLQFSWGFRRRSLAQAFGGAATAEAADDASLELGLRVAWLNHITAFGFTVPPKPLAPQPLPDAGNGDHREVEVRLGGEQRRQRGRDEGEGAHEVGPAAHRGASSPV